MALLNGYYSPMKKARSQPADPSASPPAATSLIRAFQSGQREHFLQLLASGADPNEVDANGTTLLTLVSGSWSGVDFVEPLLQAGADPNRPSKYVPLVMAAGNGVESVIRHLLAAGAQVDAATEDGRTALMAAAASGNIDVVQLLLDAGADPNAEDNDGRTPYRWALDGNNQDIADLLRGLTNAAEAAEMPWRLNKERLTPPQLLLAAVQGGDVEYVRRFLAEGAPVDVQDDSFNTPLQLAAEYGRLEIVDILLAAGAALELAGCADRTPLLAAVHAGELQVVHRLLAAGANPSAGVGTGKSALVLACTPSNGPELVALLIAAGVDPNAAEPETLTTPLHEAAERNQPAIVAQLLAAGADVDARDHNGMTPFLIAALRADVPTLELLLHAGASAKAVDDQGRDAATLAKSWGKQEVADYLAALKAGT